MATKKTTKKCAGLCGKTLGLDKFGWRLKKDNRRMSICRECRNAERRELTLILNPEREAQLQLRSTDRKQCTGPCGNVKPRTEFNWANKAKGWVQPKCRDCQREINRLYGASEKGREARMKYGASEKGREAQKRYIASEKGKKVRRKYAVSPKNKKAMADYYASPEGTAVRRKYVASPAGKRRVARYAMSPHGKETMRKYRQSPAGKESSLKGQIKRRARKKEQLCECCDPNEREQTYVAGWMEEDCYICGTPANETDHVIPLAAGNPGDELHCLDNFEFACKDCNRTKSAYQWPAHLGWDASPGWQDFLHARRTNN